MPKSSSYLPISCDKKVKSLWNVTSCIATIFFGHLLNFVQRRHCNWQISTSQEQLKLKFGNVLILWSFKIQQLIHSCVNEQCWWNCVCSLIMACRSYLPNFKQMIHVVPRCCYNKLHNVFLCSSDMVWSIFKINLDFKTLQNIYKIIQSFTSWGKLCLESDDCCLFKSMITYPCPACAQLVI